MSDCIEHQGYKDKLGYGKCSYKGVSTTVHRRQWLRERGPIPDGLFVLHKCDNPSCYNLDHLYLGTQKDNIRDQFARNRSRWQVNPRPTHCKRGHEFTTDNVYVTNAGKRHCRSCQRERDRTNWPKRKDRIRQKREVANAS